MASYLPQAAGMLPAFLLFVLKPLFSASQNSSPTNKYQNTTLCWGNSLQCFLAPAKLHDLYSGPNGAAQVTKLSAHTMGVWTLLSGLLRLYTAYHLGNPQLYTVALGSYAISVTHFVSEFLVFRTMKLDFGCFLSIGIDIVGLAWMYNQWDWYVSH